MDALNYSCTSNRYTSVVPWAVGLTCVVAFACIVIELLNGRAGFYLPRTDTGKWRQSIVVSEAMWRQVNARWRNDPGLLSRVLTSSEQATMRKEIRRAVANNQLRDASTAASFLQYPLVFYGGVLCALGLFQRPRRTRLVIACAVVLAVCAAMTVYRGCFSSIWLT